MSIKTFIRDNQEEIIREFSAFAKTLMPSDAVMSEQDLRDHGAEILTAVAIPASADSASGTPNSAYFFYGTA